MVVASVDRCVRNGADEVERHLAGTQWAFRYLTGTFGWWSARSVLDEGSCVRAAALLRTGLVQLNQGSGLGC